jgi:ferredoxin
MDGVQLPIGCYVRFEKVGLQPVIDRLRESGYRVIGPTVADGAIILDDIESVEQLPLGVVDEQEAGRYRLARGDPGQMFDHVVGPHSLKSFLFPARSTVMTLDQIGPAPGADGNGNGNGSSHAADWRARGPDPPARPLAVVGARACDLSALAVLDRVLRTGPYPDPDYAARRDGLFVIAVNCGRAAPTCFCASMGTGPVVHGGFDLALTELSGHFVAEVGTERGGQVIAAAPWVPCSTREVAEAQAVPNRTLREMEQRRQSGNGDRWVETAGLPAILVENLEDPRWEETALRCLACGNCTMACPTCFCSTVEDVSDLAGTHVARVRHWETCFNSEHSYMNSGTVRKGIAARYRQWLTHKLGTWHGQFGCSGCVGCGRCITWCPVGIDLTEEVAAIRGGTP